MTVNLKSGLCYEVTRNDGSKFRFKFLDNRGGKIRITRLVDGVDSDLDSEGGGFDFDTLTRVPCGDHTDVTDPIDTPSTP